MKNGARLLPLLILLASASACAGKPSFVYASDPLARFNGLTSYAWYEDPNFKMPHGGGIVDGRFIDEHVRASMDKTLRKKGFAPAGSGQADLYVSYHTDAEGVVSQDKFGGYNWWSGVIVVGAKYQSKGSLTIDIRDRGYKLVWRGAKSAILGRNPEAIAGDIDDAVSDLLAKFPPTEGSAGSAPPKP